MGLPCLRGHRYLIGNQDIKVGDSIHSHASNFFHPGLGEKSAKLPPLK